MEYFRLVAQGRLSEAFGPAALEVDKAMRTLGIRHSCQNHSENLHIKEAYEYTQAYVEGINEFAQHNMLPIQYYIFGVEFKNWTVDDTCSVLKLMHYSFSHNWGSEIARDYVEAFSQDSDLVQKLFPFEPTESIEYVSTIISDMELKKNLQFEDNSDYIYYQTNRKANKTDYFSSILSDISSQISADINAVGSNSWVVSGNFTKSKKTIMSNDPHLGNSIPSNVHMSHIIFPDGKFVAGFSVPGIPIHCIFTTDKVAQTITSLWADNSDVYEERINENDEYEYMGKIYPLEVRKEIIKVKGQNDTTYQ